jgi:replicative DNA helicase
MTGWDTDLSTGVSEDTPQAVESERAVLAAAMWSPEAMAEAVLLLSDDDWYRPIHADLWLVMRRLYAAGVTVEPRAVYGEALKLGRDHVAVVVDLGASGMAFGDISYHCQRISDATTARELRKALHRGWQLATSPDREPIAVAEDIIESLRVVQRIQDMPSTEIDVLDLVRRRVTPPDWVIPDLLARMNRLILTAPEGWGKSTLLRQIAMCVSAGLHPFRPEGISPRRVYVLDAENPEDINTEEYGRIYDYLDNIGQTPKPGMLIVDEHRGGVDLLDSKVAAGILNRLEQVRPDLIIVGPLYQLHDDNPHDEGPARKLARALDRMRSVNQSALITEAHSPHSDGPGGQMLRPFGASLWKRWPEFGFCLHPVPVDKTASAEARHIAESMKESQFTPWRGQRGRNRTWPKFLSQGSRLPWEEHQPLTY